MRGRERAEEREREGESEREGEGEEGEARESVQLSSYISLTPFYIL